MRRGEVWWAQLRPPAGPLRPVLLIHRDRAYSELSGIVVAQLMRTIREIPSCVLLTTSDGVPKRSVVNCDNLLTISRSRLTEYITSLNADKMHEVDAALRFVLDLDVQ